MRDRCLIVGVGGASGSGKSTLCRALRDRLGFASCAIIEMDRYYRDLRNLPPEERDRTDFDAPEALEMGLLVEHLGRLAAGHDVRLPTYDFATHTRIGAGTHLAPAPVVLVEGIFCLVSDQLRRQLDWSVFVMAPDETCLERRLARDVIARGRTAEQVREQYIQQVRPAAERIVLPSARHARRVLSGTRSLDELCGMVLDDLGALTAGARVLDCGSRQLSAT